MAKIGINIATGSLQQSEMIVGIDLGTTNSLVAIIHPESKQPVALQEHNTSSLVPSVIHFNGDGSVVVGEEAKKIPGVGAAKHHLFGQAPDGKIVQRHQTKRFVFYL